MMELTVGIEINGLQKTAGMIRGSSAADAVFSYSRDYFSSGEAKPLSVSLPFQEEPFSPEQTRRFFEGLLPEGFTRRAAAQWMRVPENDYLSLLHGLGRECLGAVRVTEEGDSDPAGYELLSLEDVKELAGEGAEKSAEIVVQSHLSLTGASGKVGLFYNGGSWYLPKGTAPSTHIVKQSHVRLGKIVTNELLCLKAAQLCGIETPESFLINTGAGRDEEILLASERYDRTYSGKCVEISGMRAPLRLHQEDFTQALGIGAEGKYEKPGDGYMNRAFALLRSRSADPIRDQLKLWDLIVFNCLVGNTDGHLKNLSLLYSPDMSGIRLAPAYDIVSTAIYPTCTRNLAFSVGGADSLDRITRSSLETAAKNAGIGVALAMKHADNICQSFKDALNVAGNETAKLQLPGVEEIIAGIMAKGAYKALCG